MVALGVRQLTHIKHTRTHLHPRSHPPPISGGSGLAHISPLMFSPRSSADVQARRLWPPPAAGRRACRSATGAWPQCSQRPAAFPAKRKHGALHAPVSAVQPSPQRKDGALEPVWNEQ